MPSTLPPLLVAGSIQARGAEDRPWEGHLASALLVDEDAVLVPDPPARVTDPEAEVEVVLVPVALREGDVVERFRPTAVELLVAADGRRTLAAVLRLPQASRHRAGVRRIDGGELGTELARHGGDLWATLEAMEVVAPGLRGQPSQDLLRRLPAIEREQRRPKRRTQQVGRLDEFSIRFCQLIKLCDPCDPR